MIERALDVRPGDAVDPDAAAALRQRVYNLRIFREVDVQLRPADGGIVVAVAVEERWTLTPIPIVGAVDGAFQAGLALLEQNLLGERKELALVGVYSTRGQTAMALYRDPAVGGSRAILASELIAENKVRQRADGARVTHAWRDRHVEASVRPGVQWTPRLGVRAGPFAVLAESEAEPGFAPPPPSGRAVGVAADLEYAGQDYCEWFDSGPLLTARLRSSLPALGAERAFTQAWSFALWTVPAFRDHAFSLSVTGVVAQGDPVLDAFPLGGRRGSRGLREGGLWTERGATASAEYQVPFWRPGWGTVAAMAFVDGGVAYWAGSTTRYVAPGAGVRVYVRNVAVPAFGVDMASSSAGAGLAMSFFLGFGG